MQSSLSEGGRELMGLHPQCLLKTDKDEGRSRLQSDRP